MHVVADTRNAADPVVVVPSTVRLPTPLFEMVTDNDFVVPRFTVPNAIVVADNVDVGCTPVPESGTRFGLDAAFVTIEMLLLFKPVVVGANAIWNVHDVPGARVTGAIAVPQPLLVIGNWFAATPCAVAPLTIRGAVPELVTRTVVGAPTVLIV